MGSASSWGAARSGPSQRQPFCSDIEGWGPISPFRYDLTPCFLDLTVSLAAAWGVFFGIGALWFLFNKRSPQPVSKNWHFYAKLVSVICPHIYEHTNLRAEKLTPIRLFFPL